MREVAVTLVAWAQKADTAQYRTTLKITPSGVVVIAEERLGGLGRAEEVSWREIALSENCVIDAIDRANSILREGVRARGRDG